MWNNWKLEIGNLKKKTISNLSRACDLTVFKSQISNQFAQSLLEVVIVIAVGLIVVSSLVFATISGLRNAQFAKNQAVATKLAQEGIESVEGIRDRDLGSSLVHSYNSGGGITNTSRFSDLWEPELQNTCVEDNPCYLVFQDLNHLVETSDEEIESSYEPLEQGAFLRKVEIKDGENSDFEKIVTVVVRWSDFSGNHESKHTTILRKL